LAARRIRLSDAEDQKLELTFNEEGILIKSGASEARREWSQFSACSKTRKGVPFSFSDGTTKRLPMRVFDQKSDIADFIDFVEKKLSESKNGNS